MNKRLYYTSAVLLPAAALLIAGAVHAASPTMPNMEKLTLTDAQKTAVQQAQDLRKQADAILEKAGLPVHPFGRGMMKRGVENRPQLTDEQKATLKQAMELRKAGKLDEAKALIEKAGLPEMPKFEHRFGSKPVTP